MLFSRPCSAKVFFRRPWSATLLAHLKSCVAMENRTYCIFNFKTSHWFLCGYWFLHVFTGLESVKTTSSSRSFLIIFTKYSIKSELETYGHDRTKGF